MTDRSKFDKAITRLYEKKGYNSFVMRPKGMEPVTMVAERPGMVLFAVCDTVDGSAASEFPKDVYTRSQIERLAIKWIAEHPKRDETYRFGIDFLQCIDCGGYFIFRLRSEDRDGVMPS